MPERPSLPPVEDMTAVPTQELESERVRLVFKHEQRGGPNPMPTAAEYRRLSAILREQERRHEVPLPAESVDLPGVRRREAERNKAFFGKDINIPPLPRGITKELASFWEQNGFELRFVPKERMDKNKACPGWAHKPDQGINLFDKADQIADLSENKNDPQLQGLHPLDLPGCWVLWDKRGKPNYNNGDQTYDNDTLIQAVLKDLVAKNVVNREAVDGLRNKIHPSVFSKPEFWSALAKVLKIDAIPNAIVRLPRVIETSVMGQGADFHGTSTWEWNKEWYQSDGRVVCGSSDGGGVSCVSWRGGAGGYVGFRPLVVFPSA